MTPRCLLCGGVVVGAHFHGIDPEQRCDACDAEHEARWQTRCACSLADLRRALAERDAGEAERVAQAVAAEREACADIAFDLAGDGGSLATWRAIRARAIRARAAPEPHPAGRAAADAAKAARARGEDVYADGEGRAVIEAAIEWRASLDGPGECWHEARMRDAVDALAAARKGGA